MTDQPSTAAADAADERRTPQVGAEAPDFSLPDADGVRHHLADRRGQWTVVYFYPRAFTPG